MNLIYIILLLILFLFLYSIVLYRKVILVKAKVDFVSQLRKEEIKKIAIKNISLFKFELNTNGKFFNENLSDELNDFFNKYQLIKIGDYHFGHKFIKKFEDLDEFMQVGLDTYDTKDKFNNSLIVKNKSDEIMFVDGENGYDIYVWIVNEVIYKKYSHLNNIDELKKAIKKELSSI